MRTSAVVLAGGAASRFGGDKLAADLRGRPVLHHALLAVDGVVDGPVVVALGRHDPVPAWPIGLRSGPVVARDPVAHRGPLAGLATGLTELGPADDGDLVLVVAGDMPSLQPAVLNELVGVLADDGSLDSAWLEAIPFAPLPMALRPARIGAVVADLLARDRRSLRSLLDALSGRALPAIQWRALDPDGATLVDIDTREDLARREG